MNTAHHNITWLCRVRLTLLLAHQQTQHVLSARHDFQETSSIWRIRTGRDNSTSQHNGQHTARNLLATRSCQAEANFLCRKWSRTTILFSFQRRHHQGQRQQA
jgi:hypothetical protein